MKTKILYTLLGIACFLFPVVSFAQQATIKGKITDAKTKETLIGVNVILDDTTGTATGIDGSYHFAVSPGSHKVVFSFIGYVKQKKSIELKSYLCQKMRRLLFFEPLKLLRPCPLLYRRPLNPWLFYYIQ